MSVSRRDLESAIFTLSRNMDKADFYDILFSTVNTNDLIVILNKLAERFIRLSETKACEKAIMEECINPTQCTEAPEMAECNEIEQQIDIAPYLKQGGLDKIQEIQEKAKKYKHVNLYELVNDVRMTDEAFEAVEELITKLRSL